MQWSSRASKDYRLSIDRPKLSRNLTKCRTNGETILTIMSPARSKHLYYTKSGDAILWKTTNSADLAKRIAQPETKYKIRWRGREGMKSPEGHLLGTRRNKTEHSRQPQAHSWLKTQWHEWGVHDKQEISRKHKAKRVRGARQGLVATSPSTTVRKTCGKCRIDRK